jgi:hypothetical protein
MQDVETKVEIDLLKRVWVPREATTPNGTIVFRTHDKELYARLSDGSIRCVARKARGKVARRADREARRMLRGRA